MTNSQKAARGIWVNLAEVWEFGIVDAIERYREFIDFSIIPYDEFKNECIDSIVYSFENDTLGNEIFYNDIVSDTAKANEMWNF